MEYEEESEVDLEAAYGVRHQAMHARAQRGATPALPRPFVRLPAPHADQLSLPVPPSGPFVLHAQPPSSHLSHPSLSTSSSQLTLLLWPNRPVRRCPHPLLASPRAPLRHCPISSEALTCGTTQHARDSKSMKRDPEEKATMDGPLRRRQPEGRAQGATVGVCAEASPQERCIPLRMPHPHSTQ